MDESWKLLNQMKNQAFYIYKVFTYDARFVKYDMHEVLGLICKTAVFGIINKFADAKKQMWDESETVHQAPNN